MDNSQILPFANTEAGRFILGIKDNAPIIKITSNSYHLRLDKNLYRATFYTDNKVEQILLPILTKINIANKEYKRVENPYEAFLHYSGLEYKNNKYPQIYLVTSTFNPNGGGNGSVFVDNNATWAGAHDAASGTASANPATANIYASLIGATYYVGRGFLPFNTASLNGGTLIAGANTVAINFNANLGGNNGQYDITTSTQASNTALVGSDYSQVSAVDGGNLTITATGVKTFTLNATGEGWINLTGGYSLLGVRQNNDVSNTAPTLDIRWSIDFAAGTTPPVLTVNYTFPSGGNLPLLGVG